MIHVTVTKESNFPVSSEKIKEAVKNAISSNGMTTDTEVSVAIVKRSTMQEYVDKYYKDGADHPVLSFPSAEVEGRFVFPPDGKIYLGEIVVSFDWCRDDAQKKGILTEDVVIEMAEHGTLHLLGIHHD